MTESIYDWIKDNVPYFIPFILVFFRYRSFAKPWKKRFEDLIVDPLFCMTPVVVSVGTLFCLIFEKRGSVTTLSYIIAVVISILLLIWSIFVFWDLTFDAVQNEPKYPNITDNKGWVILLLWFFSLGLSLFVRVIIH